jgi:hypothetical protein
VLPGLVSVAGTERAWVCSGGFLGRLWRGQLKAAGNNSGDRQVFIQVFPPQGGTTYLQSDLPECVRHGLSQDLEAIGRKTKDAPIRQFKMNHPASGPSSGGAGFYFNLIDIHDIY